MIVASSKPQPGKSLAETNPELASQAHGWDPSTVTASSGQKRIFICKFGHQYISTPGERTRGRGCSVCAGKSIVIGSTDLVTTHPHVANEADGWDPTTVSAGSNKRKRWICQEGHRWETSPLHRTSGKGQGCPTCSNRIILAGFNDLATARPDLAIEADGWDPTTVASKSGMRVSWRCSSGHKWKQKVQARFEGRNCPICSNKQLLAGFNDLATTHPHIAKEVDGWDPKSIIAGSNKFQKWRCPIGHTYKTKTVTRSQGSNCPYCSGHKVLKGFNDLATRRPDIAAEAFDWDPSTVSELSGKKYKWNCDLGHVWAAVIANRTGQGHGCPYCSNTKVLKGFNDLATRRPDIAAEAFDWDPTTVTAGASKRQRWICSMGHKWTTTVSHRVGGSGCPSCVLSGFDPNQDAWLYLIENGDLRMFKIGISNYPESRLKDHASGGWEIIELRGPMDGHLTQKLETDCLHALEKRGAILGHKAGIDKFDGYSEAWTKASLNVTSIKQILDWVYEDVAK